MMGLVKGFWLLASAALALLCAAGGGHAADKLTVAVNKFSSGSPLYIAQAKGFFKEEGLEVAFLHSHSAQSLGLAIASGDAAVGLTALTAGTYTLADRGSIRMIAGGLEEKAGFRQNAIVVGQAAFERGVRGPGDFPGLRIGASQTGSPQENQWARFAAKSGFRYSDLRIVPLQTIPNIVSSLRGGQVDAAALPATLALQLQGSGSGSIVAWMGDVVPSLFAVISANAGVVKKDPELLVRFLRAYLRAIAYYDEAFQRPQRGGNYEEALRIIASALEEPPGQVAESLPYFNPAATLKTSDLDEQIEVWRSLKYVRPTLRAQNVIDTSLLEKARAGVKR